MSPTAADQPTRVPSAKGLPLIGVLPGLAKDPFGFCMKAAAEGDGLIRLQAGPKSVYLISHPDYVHHVLVGNAANYVKGSIMDGIRTALGNGLFTSDGALWKRQRRLMQPAFHGEQVKSMIDDIVSTTQEAITRWQPQIDRGEPIDMLGEMTKLNIAVILKALFGSSADTTRIAALQELTARVFRGMAERVWTFFIPQWIPTPGSSAYRQSIHDLDREVYALITERRDNPEQHNDLLGMLLNAHDADTDETMSDKQLRDEIFTIFMAGYDSTSGAMTWLWYYLARNPDVASTLHKELDTVLAGRAPSYSDLGQLTYTTQVINETLRLYPIFPMFFRSSVQADVVGPYLIPANAQLIISPYATHRDPRFWPEPTTFDPDRFSTERFDRQARRAYYPFGEGQRLCIGEPMARTITQVVVTIIAQHYNVRMASAERPDHHYAMALLPKNGLSLLLSRR